MKKELFGILAASAAMFGFKNGKSKQEVAVEKLKTARHCSQCMHMKIHNNIFCSPECCKGYNRIQKAIRKNIRIEAERVRLEKHYASPCFDGERRKELYGYPIN